MSFCANDEYQSGAKLIIYSDNSKPSFRFFILHANFCQFVIRIIQHDFTFSVQLSHSGDGILFINGFNPYDTAQYLQHFYAVLLHTSCKNSTKAREKWQ